MKVESIEIEDRLVEQINYSETKKGFGVIINIATKINEIEGSGWVVGNWCGIYFEINYLISGIEINKLWLYPENVQELKFLKNCEVYLKQCNGDKNIRNERICLFDKKLGEVKFCKEILDGK